LGLILQAKSLASAVSVKNIILPVLLAGSVGVVFGQQIQNPPIPDFYTPEESMKRIKLQEGSSWT